MFDKVDLNGKKTICLVSGGNIDVGILSRVITRGLVMSGRNSSLTLKLADRPGQLEAVSKIISDHGANVVSVLHSRIADHMQVNNCILKIGLETRNFDHVHEIETALQQAGFELVEDRS